MSTNHSCITPLIRPLVATAATLAAGLAVAQTTPPAPLDQAQPEAPTNRFGMPIEGWATVRYSVLADGSTSEIEILDVFPDQIPQRTIRAAVEDWTFEPAMRDGSPVDWHRGESIIVFDAEAVPAEPRPMFVRGYREVESLIAEGDLEAAVRRNRRLLDTETSRLAELGVALVQRGRVQMLVEDNHAAYDAIRRATDPRAPLLEESELIVALEYRNRLELALGDVVGAMETYARRRELGEVPESDVMAANHDRIEAALDGDAAIAVQGKILDDTWSHTLTRRTFAIGDLDGSLRSVHVRCDHGKTELEYSQDSEWTLPDSWGTCTATAEGRRDTEFVLYEFQ